MRLRLWFILLAAVLAPTWVAAGGEPNAFVRGSWKEIRTAHAGRPTVVHFWGLTCGPCRTEMPQWGELVHQRADLALVLIDADLAPNEPAAVTAMLARSGLSKVESWLFSDGFVERLRHEIDPQWQGEIPYTLLIGRDGTTQRIEGIADLEAVRRWLDAQASPSQ
jgi:thiol-disulfide isomerase/thioredoxin